MLHDSGKHDLRFGSAEALESADEAVEAVRAVEDGLHEHGIFPCYVAAFDHIGTLCEKRVKLSFSVRRLSLIHI